MQTDIGRNDPCPCGSGLKFKKCCLNKPQAVSGPIENANEPDALIVEGYDLLDQGDEAGACAVWLMMWEALKARITPDMKSIGDAETLFGDDLSLSDWAQDVETELANAALDNPAFHEKRVRFGREFIRTFPRSGDLVKLMKLAVADSLFQLGRKTEAEEEYKRMVVEYPKYPWSYIHWGDFYAGDDNKKAEELYRKALGLSRDEDTVIQERIRDLKTEGSGKP